MIFAMDTDDDRVSRSPKSARNELEPLAHLTEQRRREEIAEFRRNSANVQIVELRHTSHYCFAQRPETVSRLIASFLLKPD